MISNLNYFNIVNIYRQATTISQMYSNWSSSVLSLSVYSTLKSALSSKLRLLSPPTIILRTNPVHKLDLFAFYTFSILCFDAVWWQKGHVSSKKLLYNHSFIYEKPKVTFRNTWTLGRLNQNKSSDSTTVYSHFHFFLYNWLQIVNPKEHMCTQHRGRMNWNSKLKSQQ